MVTVLRGGKLLNIAGHSADNRDILIENGVIREIGPPGFANPEGSTVIDASDRLLMPGLINAHTHGHGSLGRGLGDRWSLELLLNAGPWMAGGRVLEDKYLSALLNAVELLKRAVRPVMTCTPRSRCRAPRAWTRLVGPIAMPECGR